MDTLLRYVSMNPLYQTVAYIPIPPEPSPPAPTS